jgi:hypothetical protein
MIYDLHVHIAGNAASGHGNYIASAAHRRLAFRLFARQLCLSLTDLVRLEADDLISRRILAWLDESEVDRAVFLALDAAYRPDGTCDWKNTRLVTSNDFVADLAARHTKVLFGASVHPYRRDALAELERVIGRGACLVKWLPAAQNIQADDPRCIPFYELLAHHRVPLLCHTGSEHILKVFPNSLNDPRRLVTALERGVTVIAAHCGTRVFLHERSYFRVWQEMALQHERFFGDLGAFGLITRVGPLQTMLRNPSLVAKLVFGSDFPVATMPLSYAGRVGIRRALELRRVANPFDQAVQTMKAAGVSDEVFSRAAKILRVSGTIAEVAVA